MLDALSAKGVQINWSQFFLNELLQDASLAQEEGTAFHYSWLLILISFTVWSEPTDYQPIDLPITRRGARYQNLWFSPDKSQKTNSNSYFYVHIESLKTLVKHQVRLSATTISKFR